MGTWGPGLYQDDVACDIKSEYANRLKIGMSNIEATQNLIDCSDSYIDEEEDESIFWFALADTQWKYGRLLPEVRDEALKRIKSGVDLKRWQENKKQYEKRKQVLETLEEKLNSPQPPEKKVSKLIIDKARWEIGDVLSYKITNEQLKDSKWYNKYVLLRVVAITKARIGGLPREYSHEFNIVAIYNWIGNSVPNLEIIDKLKFIVYEDCYGWVDKCMTLLSISERKFKKLPFDVLLKDEKYERPEERIAQGLGIPWSNEKKIDDAFVQAINIAEENNILINDTLS